METTDASTTAARILVVDDEKRMCDSLDSLLTKAGYEVITAEDGQDALDRYRQSHFDLVISDIKLPKLDGIELLQSIRQGNPDAIVILMTAYASLDTALAAINMGAYDYLLKPIEFTQLRLAAKRALEKRDLEQAQKRLMAELQIKNDLLNRRIAEVDALYQAGVVLSQSQDLSSLLTKIIELALSVIGANVGSVMLLDEDGEELTIAAAVGLSEDLKKEVRLKLGESIAGYVAKNGEPVLVQDIKSDKRFARFGKGKYETNSLISVPLRLQDRILGVLNLSDPEHGTVFEENDLKLLVTFASQAAVAIDDAENLARLSERLTEFATLYDLATKITTVDNSADMTELILASLKRIMDVDFTIWFIWSERSKTLELRYWVGFGSHDADSLAGKDLKLSEKDVYQTDIRSKAVETMISEVPALREFTKSLTVVPIITGGSLHGLFCLGSATEAAFSENDEYIASIVASQATSIYEQQRAVLNATRLVTMGKMMSEISHDLNRPLTNIRGSLQVMRERWPEITQSDDFFHAAEEELGRLNELVKELVGFSNPAKFQLEEKRIDELIERVIRLVENDLKKHEVKIVMDMEGGLPPIPVDENKIIEMLLNLIINAIDAMPEGGTLTFSGRALPPTGEKGHRVELRIADTGVGIPPEQVDKIYDRYFTTKESGTGLGLAICERIVKAHNGVMSLETESGRGTTFIIELPVT